MSKPASRTQTPVITEEADRRLGRIILRHGALTFALLLVITFVMAFVNIPQSRLYHIHRMLDTLSVLVVVIPFYLGINRLFAARLEIGRDLVAERQWTQAIAALEPFNSPSQRFLDGTGEAHYLIAQAYSALGKTAKATAARNFVLKHRRGVWADKLQPPPPIRPGKSISVRNAQEKRTATTNIKRRRRF